MRKLFGYLASFFGSISRFFEKLSKPAVKVEPKIDKTTRLRDLLKRSDLAADEQKELAELVQQFEGAVIFLDASVQTTAQEEL